MAPACLLATFDVVNNWIKLIIQAIVEAVKNASKFPLMCFLVIVDVVDTAFKTALQILFSNNFNTQPHEHLFLSRHTATRRGGIEKVLEYLFDYLPVTFSHPDKSMENCDISPFLHSVLQVYLEFWNSSGPFQEYAPNFTKPSRCVQDECRHMITETVSLLNHIGSYQYLPNINTVEKMDDLQKLNMDLIEILDQYNSTNIWTQMCIVHKIDSFKK